LGANHLPQGQGLNADGRGGTQFAPGMGFGLGFSVVDDPCARRVAAGKGTLAWGGAAGPGSGSTGRTTCSSSA
jgi:hypothetical protein